MIFYIIHDSGNREDKRLAEELERLHAVRILESCWCLRMNETAPEMILAYLRMFCSNDDAILITEAGKSAGVNFMADIGSLKLIREGKLPTE